MNFLSFSQMCLVTVLLVLGANFVSDIAVAAQPDGTDDVHGMQVLTRGPVHEAFAETISFDPQPGIVVSKTPPAAIEELPPEHKPQGTNVAWIPGYWAWDDDSSDFLWVSGIWRALPPGRQWVSGYWTASAQRAQWTSGYWADAGLTEAEYLPEPPESVEAGPNIAQPAPDDTWLPGCWVWQQNRYAWRPGFWSSGQANWIWTPAHYTWTPRGYIFVDGYWDYPVARRGVLFAPVSFPQSVYSQQGFSYTPSTVIDLGVFASHLFLRPNYGHYYYGDYYGANYATAGFYPWFSFTSGRHGYDPIYSHQRWNHRQDGDWERRVQTDFQNRRDHEEARPPRTFAAQQELVRKGLTGQDQGRVFAQPLERYTKAKDSPLRFQPLNNDDRQRLGQLGQEVRTHRQERQKLEAHQAVAPTGGRPAGAVVPTAAAPARAFEPARVPLPRSPLAAQPVDQFRKGNAMPQRHQAPQIDPNVVPKPRQPRSGPAARGGNPNVIKPQETPQGQAKGRSAGKTPGASNVKPPGASQGKPQGGSRDKPKEKPKTKPKE